VSRARGVVVAGALYHVVNRAVDRRQMFDDAADYAVFIALMVQAGKSYPIDVLAYCLMPNHWHLILRPLEKRALSAYMQWLEARHVFKHRRARGTSGLGHLYQSRFNGSMIETDAYFWNAFVYVEANALRAKLVDRAENWEWGSLYERHHPGRGLIVPPPLPLPSNWTDLVNRGLDQEELQQIRDDVRRGLPHRASGFLGV
jgi:putative transposase